MSDSTPPERSLFNIVPRNRIFIGRYALIPIISLAALAIFPELTLRLVRGSAWNGSYFVSNYDEVAYSAYVNALINGSSRKNDPFLAVEDSSRSPQPESFYSIQFVPAYALALPARMLGLSASSAFIILSLFAAILSAMAIFSLLYAVTEEELLSAVGALVILCFGTAAAFQGQLGFWLRGSAISDFFPFLRRYQPGFIFPLFFVFCGLVWRNLMQNGRKKEIIYSVLAGLSFAVLVFSYFYLWTAAAAWLACLTLLYLLKKDARFKALINAGIIGLIAAVTLIPYSFMIANRSTDMDTLVLLKHTHLPHLASVPLISGLIIAIAILFAVLKGVARLSSHRVLFAISFTLTPLILSNQQILTGRSLQPVHYEIFISNYLVLTALILFLSLVFQHLAAGKKWVFRRALFYTAFLALGWGVIEATGSIKRTGSVARLRDESIPAIAYIDSLERMDHSNGATNERPAVVLATNFITTSFIPSVSSLRALWTPHTSFAGGIDFAENRRLFYLYMFYSGYNEKDLAEALKNNVFEVNSALFGPDRALPALGHGNHPISEQERQSEIGNYAEFAKHFDKESAVNPLLSYLIVSEEPSPNLSNLDQWYERDEGKTLGRFRVYSVKLRTQGIESVPIPSNSDESHK